MLLASQVGTAALLHPSCVMVRALHRRSFIVGGRRCAVARRARENEIWEVWTDEKRMNHPIARQTCAVDFKDPRSCRRDGTEINALPAFREAKDAMIASQQTGACDWQHL